MDWDASIVELPGCDARTASCLRRAGVRRARDLLFRFPRDYQDVGRRLRIAELRADELCTLTANIEDASVRETATGSVFSIVLNDGADRLRCVWFNQPFHERRLRRGLRVTVTGKPKWRGFHWELSHPQYEIPTGDDGPESAALAPVYRLTEGVTQARWRSLARQAVESLAPSMEDILPEAVRREKSLLGVAEALAAVHAPRDCEHLEAGRRRLVYQELLIMQAALALRRTASDRGPQAMRLAATARIDARIRRLFPFPLTDDQHRAVEEVAGDMAGARPMNRLLQGDVGSGKTVVAIYAMLLAVAHGAQAVLMAPTEVLARQHMRTLRERLRGSRVRMGLLTGSLTAKQRKELTRAAAAGDIDLVVGTQAVLHVLGEQPTLVPKLGLVIVDEQHKFGVRQRARLRALAQAPHYLLMTATPIPRTVAMSMFGDLDVSILKRPPAGRPVVKTYRVEPAQEDAWWEFVARKIREGRQAYVVAPLVGRETEVEENDGAPAPSEDRDDDAATEPAPAEARIADVHSLHKRLAAGPLRAARCEALHGGMTSAEKDAAMQRFERGEFDVLIASSVVEVGLDVPNASIMTIFSGERFGLAALHQLRGRVNRGSHPGYCGVLTESVADAGRERLDAFVATSDGFELAEMDYRMRGPGSLFGWEQHGLPPLHIADLARDADMVREAREDVRRWVATCGAFGEPAWDGVRERALRLYGSALDLGDLA